MAAPPFAISTGSTLAPRDAPGAGISVRLIPIGDSITQGYLSSDKNGYRLFLHNMLWLAGFESIDFIGSMQEGDNNPDNQHQGLGGGRISGIQARMVNDSILNQHPNIALIHAGTNDMAPDPPDQPCATAPARLGDLIDTVLSSDPEAIVLVAKIIRMNSTAAQMRIQAFNDRVPNIVNVRADHGFKVKIADLSHIGSDVEELLSDGVHPTDLGYGHMAKA